VLVLARKKCNLYKLKKKEKSVYCTGKTKEILNLKIRKSALFLRENALIS